MNSSVPIKKPSLSAKAGLSSTSIPRPTSKKMIANHGPTTTGVLRVQQMIEYTFVNGSDVMFHSIFLPFKKVHFTFVPCYLVGIERKYSSITYTQSHGRKWMNCPTFINWSSNHTKFHHLIPQCIEIDEFVRKDKIPQVEEDQFFSVSHLHHLQASFNSKVTEIKKAADLLAEYTKKVT